MKGKCHMPTDMFVDPYTKTPLEKDSEGNLYYNYGNRQILYKSYNGCYDFVDSDSETRQEREHYDKEYSKKQIKGLSMDMVKSEWFDEMLPWRKTLLESLGNIADKRILLVGNGESSKEIYFQQLGATVIFTDLSIEAVKCKRREFELSKFSNNGFAILEFHAVDALHLPFPDNSLDIVYGAAFVHHLDDLEQFFKEVYRCLKTNGICRFLDQAHSPLWSFLKQTVLRPLKIYSYWRNPRSPGDLMANRRGGFTKKGLRSLMEKHGFKDMIFIREWFFFGIVHRHYGKLVNWDPTRMRRARPIFQFMKWIDTLLSEKRFMKRNGLALVWGFKK